MTINRKVAAGTAIAFALIAGPAVVAGPALAQTVAGVQYSSYSDNGVTYGVPGNPYNTNGDLDAGRN